MSTYIDPTRPIYLQIMEEIKRRAVRGQYRSGEQLPSVRDLAREMGVNPNTAARVYSELEREGFIFTRRGQGSFISEEPDRIGRERDRFAREAARRCIESIRELELTEAQIEGILTELTRSLRGIIGEAESRKEK
jgi:GntR family transcriptional regulator